MNSETELWESLARYMAGEASAEEATRVRAWLAADPARAELFDRLREPMQQLRHDAEADVDVDAALRAVKSRMAEAKVYDLSATRSRRLFLRAAAAAVIVAGGSLIWKASQNTTTGTAEARAQVFESGTGRTETVHLTDGTRVVLAPSSHLRVAAGYGKAARVVELNGLALFDVHHDGEKPFTVRTSSAIIRDIGTTFTVRTGSSAVVEVAVTAGSVVLHARDGSEQDGLVLKAGDRGALQPGGRAIRQASVVSDADTAFAQGRLVFRETKLSDVAADLKRWYGIELKIDDDKLASRHITASFEGESKEQVVNVIALALGVRIELDGDTAYVRSR